MTHHYKTTSALSEQEFEQAYNLILKGGEVEPNSLRVRLQNAALIGFIDDRGKIVSVAVIKNPDEEYRNGVFKKAYSKEQPDEYRYELGYVFTEEAFRRKGLARRLCKHLCYYFLSYKLYATTLVENTGMQAILLDNYFSVSGSDYESSMRKENLKLYVRQGLQNTYEVSVSKTQQQGGVFWSYSLIKVPRPNSENKNRIAHSECIPNEDKHVIVSELLKKARKLDFLNNEILLLPTFERMLSIEQLMDRLQHVG